jgi:hypothetical protein
VPAGKDNCDRLHAASALMQDDVACRNLVKISELLQSEVIPIRTSKRQSTQFANPWPIARGKNDRDVKNSISLVDLPDNVATISGPDDIENLQRIEAPADQIALS